MKYDTNLRETEVLLLVGFGETESELFCWRASETKSSLLQWQAAAPSKKMETSLPLHALSCWVRTLRISFTHSVLTSGVGACKIKVILFADFSFQTIVCQSNKAAGCYLDYKNFFPGVAPNLKLLVVSLSVLRDSYSAHLNRSRAFKYRGNCFFEGEPSLNLRSGSVWSCTTALSRSPPRSPLSSCRRAGPSRAGTGVSAWAWTGPGPLPWRGLFYVLSRRWRSPASAGGRGLRGYPEDEKILFMHIYLLFYWQNYVGLCFLLFNNFYRFFWTGIPICLPNTTYNNLYFVVHRPCTTKYSVHLGFFVQKPWRDVFLG